MIKKRNKAPTRRKRYHHGDLRRELLLVARGDISRHGANAVSLSSIARRAGVSQPAPYRHFTDMNALLEALAVEGFEELTAAVIDAASRSTPEHALRATAIAYLSYAETNKEIYRLMFASRLVPEAKPGSALGVAADEAFDLLRPVVAAISPTTPVDDNALLVWAQLHGLAMLKVDGFINRPLRELVEVSSLLNAAIPS